MRPLVLLCNVPYLNISHYNNTYIHPKSRYTFYDVFIVRFALWHYFTIMMIMLFLKMFHTDIITFKNVLNGLCHSKDQFV